MNWIVKTAYVLNKATLFLCAVLFALMSISVLGNVILRYALSSGSLWLQDLALFSFGLLAVLSIPCALNADKHVRVDIFRQKQNVSIQRRTDIIGIIVFALPVFVLLLAYVWSDVVYSINIGEGSAQIGGLPFFYLVKAGLPLTCILMMVQGVAIIIGDRNTRGKAD